MTIFFIKKIGALAATVAVLLLLTVFLINLLEDCKEWFAGAEAFFATAFLVVYVLGALCFFILISHYYNQCRSELELAGRFFVVSIILTGVFTAAVLARLFISISLARTSGTTLAFFWRRLDVYSAAGGTLAAAASALAALFLKRHKKKPV